MNALDADRLVDRMNRTRARKCRECGCTDDNCAECVKVQGYPCHWHEDDLCSRCANELERKTADLKRRETTKAAYMRFMTKPVVPTSGRRRR